MIMKYDWDILCHHKHTNNYQDLCIYYSQFNKFNASKHYNLIVLNFI